MKLIKQRKLSGNIIGIILMLTMVLAALIMSGLVKSLNDDINFRLMLFCRFIFSFFFSDICSLKFFWSVLGTSKDLLLDKVPIFFLL